ncbi:hypothetical protein [Rathayibacter sp. AY1C2]|uniref:hypothetical protein n=1 Tax=Rathayibacter sp. AY1C2 TaxID=2080535 RepID=UPI0011B010E1|nr:hypothetical protein [Rathayibacter sp. AY1C2]
MDISLWAASAYRWITTPPWFLYFLQDETFWDWCRPALAALVTFTLTQLNQRNTAQNQLRAQGIAGTLQLARDKEAWERDKMARLRESNQKDIRLLYARYTQVYRDLLAARPSLAETIRGASWQPKWSAIWTEERSLEADVLGELLLDPEARSKLKKINRLLDGAADIAADTGGRAPTSAIDLRELGKKLTSSAVDLLAAYLRGEKVGHGDDPALNTLENLLSGVEEWDAAEELRQMQAEEAEAEAEAEAAEETAKNIKQEE